MKHRYNWRLAALAVPLLFGLLILGDLTKDTLFGPRDRRTAEQKSADQMIDQIMTRTGGNKQRLSISEWKMYREWKATGTIRGIPPKPGDSTIPGEVTSADLAAHERMRRIFRRCRGNWKLLSKADGAFIRSYVAQEYPIPKD